MAALFGVMATWLAGCANVNDASVPTFNRPPPAHVGFEDKHQAQARQQAAEGDLAEAAFHWEVLTVLRPGEKEYEEKLAQTRAQIERATSELMRNGRQAQQKGAWDEAAQRYLSLLALDPTDKTAAQALRAVERERVKRDQLGKYSSRQLQQPRIPVRVPAPVAAPAAKPAPKSASRPAPAPISLDPTSMP